MLPLLKVTDSILFTGWVIGLFLLTLLIVMLVKRARHRERLRVAALGEVASGLGLEFWEKDDEGLCARISRFKVGNVGHSKIVKDVISGVFGGEEVLFCNYRYVVGHGKHQHASRQSLMFLTLKRSLPDLVMAPEGFFSKVGQVFGGADIDFLTHPEFSKKYLLKGEDEDSIKESFDFDLLEYFEQRLGMTLEVKDGELVFFRSNKRCKPEGLEPFLEEGFELKAALEGQIPS